MAGLVITKLENKELLNPYIFAICDYEEKIDDIVDDIVNIADGEGLGLLITSNLNINIEQGQAWEENVKFKYPPPPFCLFILLLSHRTYKGCLSFKL